MREWEENKTGSRNQQRLNDVCLALIKVDKFLLPNFFSLNSFASTKITATNQRRMDERSKKRNLVYYTNQWRLFIHTYTHFCRFYLCLLILSENLLDVESSVIVCAHLTCSMAYRARDIQENELWARICSHVCATNTTVKRKHTSNRVVN